MLQRRWRRVTTRNVVALVLMTLGIGVLVADIAISGGDAGDVVVAKHRVVCPGDRVLTMHLDHAVSAVSGLPSARAAHAAIVERLYPGLRGRKFDTVAQSSDAAQFLLQEGARGVATSLVRRDAGPTESWRLTEFVACDRLLRNAGSPQ